MLLYVKVPYEPGARKLICVLFELSTVSDQISAKGRGAVICVKLRGKPIYALFKLSAVSDQINALVV